MDKLNFELIGFDPEDHYYKINCDDFDHYLFPHDKLAKTPILGIFLLVMAAGLEMDDSDKFYDVIYGKPYTRYVETCCYTKETS